MQSVLRLINVIFLFYCLEVFSVELRIPKNNSYLTANPITFKWESSTIVNPKYKIIIAKDSILNDILISNIITTDSFQFSVPTNGNSYYWMVVDLITNTQSATNKFTYTNPLLVSQIKHWYKPDFGITTTGSFVSAWNDATSNALNLTQSNQNNMPTFIPNVKLLNNYPSLRFTPTELNANFLSNTTPSNVNDFSIYMVRSYAPIVAPVINYFQTVLCGPNCLLLSNSSALGNVGPSILQRNPPETFLQTPNNTTNLVENLSIYSYSNSRISINQKFLTSTGGPVPNFQFTEIGSWNGGQSSAYSGTFAELIIVDKKTNNLEDSIISGYLRSKFTPPVNLGADITSVNSFCDTIRIYAEDRFVSYLWSTGETTRSIRANTNGKYSVKVKDIFGMESSDEINIFPYHKLNKKTVYFCKNQSVQIDLKLNATFSIQWAKDGINTTTGSQISISQPGTYTVSITDSKGCTFNDTLYAQFTTFSLSPTPVNKQINLCDGEKMVVNSNIAIDSIRWSNGNNLNYNIFTTGGSYNIYAMSSNGCVYKDTFTVAIVGKAPVADFITSSAVCQNANTAFTDISTKPAVNTITNWKWNFSNGLESNNQNPTTIYPTTGTVSASLKITTDAGCTDSIFKTFTVNKKPTAVFENRLSCAGSPTLFVDRSLAGSGTLTSWLWNTTAGNSIIQNPTFNFNDAGSYPVKLTVTNSLGCTDTVTNNAVVNPSPISNFSFDSVCGRSPVHFKFLATVQQPDVIDPNSINWDFGDGFTVSRIYEPDHSYSTPGIYPVKLYIASSNRCGDTVVKNVRVFDAPIIDFSVSNTQCVNKQIQFTDISYTTDGTQITKRNWFFSGQATSSLPNPTHTFTEQGNYTIQLNAENAVGCKGTKFRSIAVSQAPEPKFTFSPQNGLPPLEVCFSNQSATNGNYYWNYGDGSNSIFGYNPPCKVYNTIGSYPITLVSTDFRGCTDSATKFILVDKAYVDGALLSVIIIPKGDFYKVQINILNNSNIEITSMGLTLQLGNGSIIRENWAGNLLPGVSTIYEFNGEIKLADNNQNPIVCAGIENINNYFPENRIDNNNLCKETKVGQFDVLSLFPNPAYETLTFGVMLPNDGKVSIRFITTLGQIEYTTEFNGVKGYNQLSTSTFPLNAATYVAEILYDGQTIRKKFMRMDRK